MPDPTSQSPGTLITNPASAGFTMLEPGASVYQTSYGYLIVSPSGEQTALSPSRNIIRPQTELTIPRQQYESGIRPISTYKSPSSPSGAGYYAPGTPGAAPQPLVITDVQKATQAGIIQPPTVEQRPGEIGKVHPGELIRLPNKTIYGTPDYGVATTIYTPSEPLKPITPIEQPVPALPGYTPVDINFLVQTPEAKAMAEQYRLGIYSGVISEREALYSQRGFLPYSKEQATIFEQAFVPSLLVPTEKLGYERIKGLFTPNTEAIASAYRELQTARGQYYLGQRSDFVSVGKDILGTIPAQAYAVGGLFKLGTVGARLVLGSSAGVAESMGLSGIAKTFSLGEKAIEPAVIIGGAGYAGAGIYAGYQRGGMGEALGETAIALEALPFAVGGFRKAGDIYSELSTSGLKIKTPAIESIYPQIFSESTTPFKSEVGFIKSSIEGLRTYVPSRAELVESTFGSKAPYKLEISEVKAPAMKYLPSTKEDVYGMFFSERTTPFSYEYGVLSGVVPAAASLIPSKEDIYGAIFSERAIPFKSEIGAIKSALFKDVSAYIPTKGQALEAMFGSKEPYKMEYDALRGFAKQGIETIKSSVPSRTDMFGSEQPYKMEISELLNIKTKFPQYMPSEADIYGAIFSERTTPFKSEFDFFKGIVPKTKGKIKQREDVGLFQKGITALKDMFSFTKTVPLESLTREEVISKKKTFPTRKPGESIYSIMKRYQESNYGLPEEQTVGKYKGFHAAPAPLTSGEIGATVGRPSDVPGLYMSPELSPLFLRVSPEYSPENLFKGLFMSEPLKPTVYRTGFEDIGRLPRGIRTARVKDISQLPEGQRTIYQPAYEYLTTKAPKGKAFITPAEEAGKTELEVVGTPGSKILEYPIKYRTEVEGRKVSIQEADILRGMGEQIQKESTKTIKTIEEFTKKSKSESEVAGYRRSYVPGISISEAGYGYSIPKSSRLSSLERSISSSIVASSYLATTERGVSYRPDTSRIFEGLRLPESIITPSERYPTTTERPTTPYREVFGYRFPESRTPPYYPPGYPYRIRGRKAKGRRKESYLFREYTHPIIAPLDTVKDINRSFENIARSMTGKKPKKIIKLGRYKKSRY